MRVQGAPLAAASALSAAVAGVAKRASVTRRLALPFDATRYNGRVSRILREHCGTDWMSQARAARHVTVASRPPCMPLLASRSSIPRTK